MEELDRLKAMLVDLGKSKSILSRQTVEFQALQEEIGSLEKKATFDPIARKKLQKLNDYMSREGNDSQRQITERIERSKIFLSKVVTQLQSLLPAPDEITEIKNVVLTKKAPKKFSRNFA